MFCQLFKTEPKQNHCNALPRSNYQAVRKERASSPCVPLARLLQQIQGGRQFFLHQSANIFSGTSDLRSILKSNKIENFDQVTPDSSSNFFWKRFFVFSPPTWATPRAAPTFWPLLPIKPEPSAVRANLHQDNHEEDGCCQLFDIANHRRDKHKKALRVQWPCHVSC